jgi:hypothetical protein
MTWIFQPLIGMVKTALTAALQTRTKALDMNNFGRGLHNFLLLAQKMYQLYETSFDAWAR